MNESVPISILARAPVAGFAKTRLSSVLGAERAASLAARLIERAVQTASQAATGSVTLWATPDASHPVFGELAVRYGVGLRRQSEGDLGARMHAAIAAANGPVLVIGTDCPGITAEHLSKAADVLRRGLDAVIFPAEDGGYGLIGMHAPHSGVFAGVDWGTARVLGQTRRRLKEGGLAWEEPVTVWDLDRPEDFKRLEETGPGWSNLIGPPVNNRENTGSAASKCPNGNDSPEK
jgi:rSAM/selenodomain-associated transferase 1